jgi:hypothetical protein
MYQRVGGRAPGIHDCGRIHFESADAGLRPVPGTLDRVEGRLLAPHCLDRRPNVFQFPVDELSRSRSTDLEPLEQAVDVG